MPTSTRRAFFVVAGLSAVACGGSDTGPTAVDRSRPCRTYATAYTIDVVSPPQPNTTHTETCTFDTPSLALRCTQTISNGSGCILTVRRTDSYASVFDFVEEAATVGLVRVLRAEFVGSGCGGKTTTLAYTFDGQKRLLRQETSTNGVVMDASIYTAWDGRGRPTAIVVAQSGICDGDTYSIAYNDAARTVTEKPTGFGPASRCPPFARTGVTTFDANGQRVKYVGSQNGVATYTETVTVTSTADICL